MSNTPTATNPQAAYEQLLQILHPFTVLRSTMAVLEWDERTQLPSKGADYRAEQLGQLSRMCHEMGTSPRVGELLSILEASDLVADPLGDVAVNVRELRRSYDRAIKLPADLVQEMSRVTSLAQHAWVNARQADDFDQFAPWLTQIIQLKRQQAECYGYTDSIYDALLEDFEPGETAASLHAVFDQLKPPLVDLIALIQSTGNKPPTGWLTGHCPRQKQEVFCKQVAAAIGFDLTAGRIDTSAHPFSTGIAPGDTRITTRYDEYKMTESIFGTLHECGHAMYSQGLPTEHFGTPRGSDVSLGIHESQSRLWENFVGRSRGFWRHFLPVAAQTLGVGLEKASQDEWYYAINAVQPSVIRIESDETTYNLHILIRFELEEVLLTGKLAVADLPAAWNQKMQDYLGVQPENNANGCLQDIHWSGGAFGYFPTYTLGNIYAAQFAEAAAKELGNLDIVFSAGRFDLLLGWLRKNIHSQGMKYGARDLVQHVTGKPLSIAPLLKHLTQRAIEVYGIA